MRINQMLAGAGTLILLLLVVMFLSTVERQPALTGMVTYVPGSLPESCYNSVDACIDMDGDGFVTKADEGLFAQILNGSITNNSDPDLYNLADFNDDGIVDNEIDFQQCFIALRDAAVDRNDGNVTCNMPADELTDEIDLSMCSHGCADLDGNGFINMSDYAVIASIINDDMPEDRYPSSDLTGDGLVDWQDRDCMTAFQDRIAICNLKEHAYHASGCPDLKDTNGAGNDGIVDSYDESLFDQYYSEGDLAADFNGDDKVNVIDRLIFEEYGYGISDCNLYHAPWHVGGIDQNFSDTASPSSLGSFGGIYNATQGFNVSRDGELTKIRFYLGFDTGNFGDIDVTIHPIDSGIVNYSVIIDTAVISAFNDSAPHWETAYFTLPVELDENASYHIVLSSPDSDDNAYIWYGKAATHIYEEFSTTACADINGDGLVDSSDEGIISMLPDNLTEDGVGDYDPLYDLNDDMVIDGTDYDIFSSLIGSRHLEEPSLVVANDPLEGNASQFGNTNYIGQSFNATHSKLSKVSLHLFSNALSARELEVEIRRDNGLGYPGAIEEIATLDGFVNQTPGWYGFEFENLWHLEIGTLYYIIISSPDASIYTAYNWSLGDNFTDGQYWYSTDGTNFYNDSSIDLAFRLYDGDAAWNSSYDFNNDTVIDSADLEFVSSAVGSWDSSWWTPLVDFNSEFGVYEKLLDKVLGFDAYMGKVLACGMPSYEISCGNGRCDEDEDYSSCPSDCSSCNYDSFCSGSEDFDVCDDCLFWRVLPEYSTFDGDTTAFENMAIDDFDSVSGVHLERSGYGYIGFLEPMNVSGLDFDSYVDISDYHFSIDAATEPRLNMSAEYGTFMMDMVYPMIYKDGIPCASCEIASISRTYGSESIVFTSPEPGTFDIVDIAPDTTGFNGSTTDMSYEAGFDLEDIDDLVIESEDIGMISFLEAINTTFGNYTRDISISRGSVDMNSASDPRLNSSALITLYGLSIYDPIIMADGVLCSADVCTLISYPFEPYNKDLCDNNCTMEFNVTHFTEYMVVENTTDPQFVSGPIPIIIFDANVGYIFDISEYFFDIDSQLAYGSEHNPELDVSFDGDYAILNNTPGWSGIAWVNFTASDSNATASSGAVAVIVKSNLPPQFQGPIMLADDDWLEDEENTVNLSSYFTDPDGDDLSYSYSFGPPSDTNITVMIEGDIATLMPDANWYGTRFITFTAHDEEFDTSSFPYTELSVSSVNDLPYQKNDIPVLVGYEDGNMTFDASAYFDDVENGSAGLDYDITASDHFIVHQAGGQFIFEPDKDWNGHEEFTITVTDSEISSLDSNIFSIYLTPVNDPIARTSKPFELTWNQNHNLSIDLNDYFDDVDGDAIFWYNHSFADMVVDISYLEGDVTFIPHQDWFGTEYINLSAIDIQYSASELVLLTVYEILPVERSWIGEAYYEDDLSGDIPGIITTQIVDSKITGPSIDLFFSTINASSVINSTVRNCTIIGSYLNNTPCYDSIIDPSDIKESNTTGSTIIDSHAWYSDIINSTLDSSTIDYVAMLNSTLINSTLYRTEIYDALVIDGYIQSGTILHNNGSLIDITAPTHLEDIINYPPVALAKASNPAAPGSAVVQFDGTSSEDRNVGSALADNLSYAWDFDGDGAADMTGPVVERTLAVGTHIVTLEVSDLFGEHSTDDVVVIISPAPTPPPTSSGGSGGGGGGGGGRICIVNWTCGDWGQCVNGSQERECVDENNCRISVRKPETTQPCDCGENWQCTEWEPLVCEPGTNQTRICTDLNTCGTELQKPDEGRSCIMSETCSDGIRNQDETDVDCGGSECSPCVNGLSCMKDSDCVGYCDVMMMACVAKKAAPVIEEPSVVAPEGFLAALLGRKDVLYIAGGVLAAAALLAVGLVMFFRKRKPEGLKREKEPEGEEPRDLGELGIDEATMRTLMDYADQVISRGYDKEYARKILEQQGWSKDILDELMRRLH